MGTNAAIVLLVCSNADRLVACWRPLLTKQRVCNVRVALVEIGASLGLCALLNAGAPFVRVFECGRCIERLASVDGALGVFLRRVQPWLVYACISLLPAVALLSLNVLLLVGLVRHERRLNAVACVMRSPLALTAAPVRTRSRGRALSAIAVLEDTSSPPAARPRALLGAARIGSGSLSPTSALGLHVPGFAAATKAPAAEAPGDPLSPTTTPVANEAARASPRASRKQHSPTHACTSPSSCSAASVQHPLLRRLSAPLGGSRSRRLRFESVAARGDSERNTYVLTLGISLLFVPLYTPILLLRPFESLFIEQLQRPALYRLLQTSFSMLQHAFHCADFYLYASISRAYRRKLLLLLADFRAALSFAHHSPHAARRQSRV